MKLAKGVLILSGGIPDAVSELELSGIPALVAGVFGRLLSSFWRRNRLGSDVII